MNCTKKELVPLWRWWSEYWRRYVQKWENESRIENWGERARSLFPLVPYNCFLLQIGWRHNHQNCFIGSWCWLVLFLKQCVLLHKKQGAGLGKGEGGKLWYFGLFRKGCQTRSSWFNCALRDDEAVCWVSIGHYEGVAVIPDNCRWRGGRRQCKFSWPK